jgi:(4S)-4-hydroxy-5-phosphonooxypentane-2,3-dione isomerase
MIIRIVKLTFQEEYINDFITIFNESKELISNFEGVKKLELLQCSTNGNIFFTHSHWESEEALEKYRHSELFKTTWAKTKPLFSEKAEAWSNFKLY